ncbi:MAG: hypothetical protein IKV94_02960 [Clostridia bacterium]|nr:hypothetical protein [Clostridia bacterium]
MTFLIALLFSISCNLDNAIFGMSCGIANIQISLGKAIIISILCTSVTICCLMLGNIALDIIPDVIEEFLGAATLIVLGIFFLIKEIVANNNTKSSVVKQMDLKRVLYISLGLSLNNMPIAIASSVEGINIILASILSMIFSTVFIYIGNIIGGVINGKFVSYIAAIIIILLGTVSLIV